MSQRGQHRVRSSRAEEPLEAPLDVSHARLSRTFIQHQTRTPIDTIPIAAENPLATLSAATLAPATTVLKMTKRNTVCFQNCRSDYS